MDFEENATSSSSSGSPNPSLSDDSPGSTPRTSSGSDTSPFRTIPYRVERKLSGSTNWFLNREINFLAPRRRRLAIRFGRRRILPAILALSIPLFALLLVSEIREHQIRGSLLDNQDSAERTVWDHEEIGGRKGVMQLRTIREEYAKKRRKEESKNEDDGIGRSMRQEIPDDEIWLSEETPVIYWPRWWGDSDQVGPSPLDHRAIVTEGAPKKRILFLTDYIDYLERMNSHTYEIVDAATRHPGLIVDVWGPNWAGYDSSLPLSVNVRRRSHRIDQLETSKRIWQDQIDGSRRSKAEERKERIRIARLSRWADVTKAPVVGESQDEEGDKTGNDEAPWVMPDWTEMVDEGCSEVRWEIVWTFSDIFKQDDPLVDALDCGALLVQQIGDCHELRCTNEWYPLANNITLSKYAFELPELFQYDQVKARFPSFEMGLFGHSPDTANEWDFWPIPWMDKSADATMFGFDGSFYPIRTTITDHLNSELNASSSIARHIHPGYVLNVQDDLKAAPLETYQIGHESYKVHRRLREDFARGMRQARICVFDSSLERKMIRKYAQAFLSGCVVAADLPTEHEEALSNFVIPLQANWPIEVIHQEIQIYLDDPSRLEQMAMDAFVHARRKLTTTRKVDEVLRMAEKYRNGVRGYDFSNSFSLRCRAYWSGEGYRPPWCGTSGYRGLES